MDLSLKQRLLGAAVLIALAVIVVPMFMSSSAPQKSAEMETSTLAIPPAPDREFQQRVLPIDAPGRAGTSPPPSGASNGDTAPIDGTSAPTPAPPATAAAVPAPSAPEPVSAAPTPAVSGAAKSVPTPAATPEPVKPGPGEVANTHFFVHLGVYSATNNAADLVADLKKGGFPAFSEASEFQGKPARRVRVGPFADRAAAEAARLRIKQLKPKVPGSVVQLASDAKSDAPASALAAGRAGGWAVQLGALKGSDDADKLRDRLRNAGFAAFVDRLDVNGSTLWRVRAGPEVDRGAADRLRAGIKEKLKLDGIIVTL